MKLIKNKIFSGILVFGLILNLLVLFDIQYLYLGAIFSFIFLITIPGLLIMLMSKIRKIGFWEYLVYTIGLSIAFLMFGGLFVNWTLPLVGIDKPLSLIPLLTSFDIFLLIFWLIAYKRNKKISLKIKAPKLDWLNKAFFVVPVIFPALSILGAIVLNNQSPNYLTMIMLGGIAAYVFFVVLFRNKFNPNVYPWAILMMSISLLLMFSLRSWYISGPDISEEYQMFQLTKENFHWSMSNFQYFRHAYNACLSVTILPTIFSSFLGISGHYVFKLFFQFVFAIIPLSVFLFLKRYTEPIFAFMAGFFFMSFPSFFILIPVHIRQGVSFVYFSLTLLVLFSKNISATFKELLFLAFGFSMVVSHYSTVYVALVIFASTFFLTSIYKRVEYRELSSKIYRKLLDLKRKGRKSGEREYYLGGIPVLLLTAFTFLWYAQLTESSYNLVDFTRKTIQNMGQIFAEEVRAEQVSFFEQFNIFYKPKDPTLLLQDYTKELMLEYKNKPYMRPYPAERYGDYKPRVTYSKFLPLKISLKIASKIYLFMEIIKKLVKMSIIVGAFHLLFTQFRKGKVDREYIIMTLVGFLGLTAIIVLPFASISYNLERTYQQVLVMLSLPAVLGGLAVFKFLKENAKVILVSVTFALYFLFFSGFIPQVVGGSAAFMQLNNFGTCYERFYTHDAEIKSIQWLSNHYNKKSLIHAGRDSRRKLLAFGRSIPLVLEGILPSVIGKNAYVYLGNTNVVNKRTYIYVKARPIGYNIPTKFLNGNKSLIYNNGESEIFK